jgi:aspartate-semialdehyde dehydrogenase
VFTDSGYTKEEIKTIDETRKILGCPSLRVTTTNVRVPVFNCHSISLNVELERSFELSELKARLAVFPGLVLTDDVKNNVYPMPINVSGHDEVYVGRVRRDESVDSGVNLWVVGDNVRKGAATNAVQIAQSCLNGGRGNFSNR